MEARKHGGPKFRVGGEGLEGFSALVLVREGAGMGLGAQKLRCCRRVATDLHWYRGDAFRGFHDGTMPSSRYALLSPWWRQRGTS